jgi:hypothetical protein
MAMYVLKGALKDGIIALPVHDEFVVRRLRRDE